MKKIALLIFLWIPLLSFSQNVTPRKSVINGDTLILISEAQLDSINVDGIEMDDCFEVQDILRGELDEYRKFSDDCMDVARECKAKIEVQERIIDEKNIQISEYNDASWKDKKKIKWLKFQRTSLLAAAIVLGFVAFF